LINLGSKSDIESSSIINIRGIPFRMLIEKIYNSFCIS
jgi:hypothetical protein